MNNALLHLITISEPLELQFHWRLPATYKVYVSSHLWTLLWGSRRSLHLAGHIHATTGIILTSLEEPASYLSHSQSILQNTFDMLEQAFRQRWMWNDIDAWNIFFCSVSLDILSRSMILFTGVSGIAVQDWLNPGLRCKPSWCSSHLDWLPLQLYLVQEWWLVWDEKYSWLDATLIATVYHVVQQTYMKLCVIQHRLYPPCSASITHIK